MYEKKNQLITIVYFCIKYIRLFTKYTSWFFLSYIHFVLISSIVEALISTMHRFELIFNLIKNLN